MGAQLQPGSHTERFEPGFHKTHTIKRIECSHPLPKVVGKLRVDPLEINSQEQKLQMVEVKVIPYCTNCSLYLPVNDPQYRLKCELAFSVEK